MSFYVPVELRQQLETADGLFHPRQDRWLEHFRWDETGIHLLGLTPTGRATIVALNMNNEVVVTARQRWVSVGWHPPDEST